MFLDIGSGIFSAIITSYLFNVDVSTWLVLFSILWALFPDVDFLYFYPKRHDTKYDHKHRDIIHYPLLYLPIGTIFIWFIMGNVWAFAFFISSFLHFLHDSIAVGWGIKWLYPFSENNYAFLYLYSRKDKRGLRKLVFSFNKDNLPKYVDEHGDRDWVKNIYYNWHAIAIIEFIFFLISLTVLYFYVK